jgi:hypothetical protein
MAKEDMYSTEMARAIVRKADIPSGFPFVPPPGQIDIGASLLLTTSPSQPIATKDAFHRVNVRYTELIYDSGLGFTAIASPFSYAIPEDGIYRITASCGLWSNSFVADEQEQTFSLIVRRPDNSFVREVPISRDVHQSSLARSPSVPTITGATSYGVFAAGDKLHFQVTRGSTLSGAANPYEHRPDERYSRLLVQLMIPGVED